MTFFSTILFGLSVSQVTLIQGATTSCSESITVNDAYWSSYSDPNNYFSIDFDNDIKGTYYFSGLDGNGWPTYSHGSSDAQFSVTLLYGTDHAIYFTHSNSLGSVQPQEYGWYAATGAGHDGDVYIRSDNDACALDRFFVESEFFDNDAADFYSSPHPLIRVEATLDDCDGIGFDINPTTSSPTPKPTPKPIVASGACSNYDTTVYSDCSSDAHCTNCQTWGCSTCESGYYKLGNLMACQSCGDNYANCDTCGDWQGCTSCDTGYELVFDSGCGDDTCK